jgi:hypothetical protein
MFAVSNCPVCDKPVDAARQQFMHALVEGQTCRLIHKIPDGTDPKTIVARLHDSHADEFKRMVANGKWTPAT